MKSTVETLGPTRVRLAIEVPFAELEPSLKKAYQTVAQQVTIPGFRRGKVPAAVIDQRVGRGAILNEAVQDVIPAQFVAAVQEHQVRTLGRPEIDNVEVKDGEPLTFTVEVDVRPQLQLPDLSEISVTVDEIQVEDSEVDEQVDGLRERFATLKGVERPVATGDYVQVDLAITVDGQPVDGGTATNLSYEVGSDSLIPGLDTALVGMSAGEEGSFVTGMVAGEHKGKDADVAVTVRSVKEKELPALDDDFAQLASEFDTLDELREDMRARLERVKRNRQLFSARDKALDELVERTAVPTPEGVVREEVAHRKEHMAEELEQSGRSLQEYLELDGKTEEELDAELAEAAATAVKIQVVLDALAEAEEVTVSEDDFRAEILRQAQQAGAEPQKYYEELIQSGMWPSFQGEVRRNKALRLLLERVSIADTAGNPVRVTDEPAEAAAGAAEPAEPA